MVTNYQQLCTVYYDATKPHASDEEISFYSQFLQGRASILEAMCGSGRLLIPLLESGFSVDGVDLSQDMLDSLFARLKERKDLQGYTIYQDNICTMSLPKKYDAIIIAVGSLQLISDLEQAKLALQNILRHLNPGGIFVTDLFVPWELLATGNNREESASRISINHCDTVSYTMQTRIDRYDQMIHSFARYKLFSKGIETLAQDEEYHMQWYYPREMQNFLTKIGFINVTVQPVDFKHNPDGFAVIGYKP